MHNHRCYMRCKLSEFECNNLCVLLDQTDSMKTHTCVRGTYRCDGSLSYDSCTTRQSQLKLQMNCRFSNTQYSQSIIRKTRQSIGRYSRDAVFNCFKAYHTTILLRSHVIHLNLSHLFPSIFDNEFIVKPYDRRLEFISNLFKLDYLLLYKNLFIHWYYYLNA